MRGRRDICREEVFEKTLPEDVWRVADNAEYCEFKDLVDIEREGCLCRYVSASRAYQKHVKESRTLSLYADRPCARTLDVMLNTAPCSVCDIIDMTRVPCVEMAGYYVGAV